MDIKECIEDCRSTGLSGWELVAYAQRAVMDRMSYSCDNPMAFPKKAFEHGKGYCVQQAYCMRYILRALGFECELVYSTKVEFPGRTADEGKAMSGHVWNRVTIDGETKDVCTTREGNEPGKAAFRPLTAVRRYGAMMSVFGWLGSIPVCIRRSRQNR